MTTNLCADCGAVPGAKGLRRGRCGACYQSHIKSLKAAGAYVSLQPVRPLLDRLMDQVVAGRGGCIIWTGHVSKRTGYGTLSVHSRPALVHRLAYELFVGPVSSGLQVDHDCHNRDASCAGGRSCLHRRCLNPFHLESVTPGMNLLRSPLTLASTNARKTHCPSGHPYDEDHMQRLPGGGRACLDCRLEKARARRRAERGDAPDCGHVSRDGRTCERPVGHQGKHQARPNTVAGGAR